jgi:hypothetical protein
LSIQLFASSFGRGFEQIFGAVVCISDISDWAQAVDEPLSKMVHYYDKIEDNLSEWAMKQSVFFIASAPLHGRHINLSPKGLPSTSFSILNPNLCGYVDATGSGIETVSHIQENGRATIMFCSFDASPRIMRLFCRGRIIPWNHQDFDGWRERMGGKEFTGMRAVVLLDVWKVSID